MEEDVTPILRIDKADRAVAWYERLGFKQASVHRFGPGFHAFVTVKRGSIRLFLSAHKGDARPDTLIYLSLHDLDEVAKEFGVGIEEQPWGPELELKDPDGNRVRVGPVKP